LLGFNKPAGRIYFLELLSRFWESEIHIMERAWAEDTRTKKAEANVIMLADSADKHDDIRV